MWKWEDAYEEYLQSLTNKEQFVQDESVCSRSVDMSCEVNGRREGSRTTKKLNESKEIHRQLVEIVCLLKAVIFCLGMLLCLLFVCVLKQ
jgi:hypothetical protein